MTLHMSCAKRSCPVQESQLTRASDVPFVAGALVDAQPKFSGSLNVQHLALWTSDGF